MTEDETWAYLERQQEKRRRINESLNDYAFPIPHDMALIAGLRNSYGMTLRDYFASKALQSFTSRPDLDGYAKDKICSTAYSLADTMMQARGKSCP